MRLPPVALAVVAALMLAPLVALQPALAAPLYGSPASQPEVSRTLVTQRVLTQPGVAKKKPRKKKAKAPRVIGQPSRNYVMPTGSSFSFPNKGKKSRLSIRNKVLYTIQSTWGGPRDRYGAPLASNGRIRIATWSFDDWGIARALVAAKKRGVSVQVLTATKINRTHASWRWLRSELGTRLWRKHYPGTNYTWSYSRACRGACRGRGGTPHAKYFLFDNVGVSHARKITMQTSMNLTWFAVMGQWNQAQVLHSARVYDDYYAVFRQARLDRALPNPYQAKSFGTVVDYFFPRYAITPAADPVYQSLKPITCYGAEAGGTGATRINVNQYAIYGDRGEWLARRLRQLWEAGCDVAIIYAVASRPVLSILRNRSGRGAIPMRQSVITNGYGTIVKYNHSKWMTIVGRWGSSKASYVTLSGSSNWGNLAAGSDEQMQRILGRAEAVRHLQNFAATWSQTSSHQPGYGLMPSITGRMLPFTFARDIPEDEPTWGRGVFRYMQP